MGSGAVFWSGSLRTREQHFERQPDLQPERGGVPGATRRPLMHLSRALHGRKGSHDRGSSRLSSSTVPVLEVGLRSGLVTCYL